MIIDKDFLSKEQIAYIENHILSNDFPFFVENRSVVGKKNKPFLKHTVLRRPEEREKGEYFRSYIGKFCLGVLDNFAKNNGLIITDVLRICVNLTYNNGFERCDVHQDHEYDHSQLIVYINECDKKSYTVVKDGKKEIKVRPEKYKGICFDNQPHYLYFPKKGLRAVMVFTFKR